MKKINLKKAMEILPKFEYARKERDEYRRIHEMTLDQFIVYHYHVTMPARIDENRAIETRKRFYEAQLEKYEKECNELSDALYRETEKLEMAISAAEGRATARTINALSVLCAASEIEKKLGIPKKSMNGITVKAIDVNAQKFPNAYKYTPESTQFDLEFSSGHWSVTEIGRARCDTSRGYIRLTEEAKAAIIRNVEKL